LRQRAENSWKAGATKIDTFKQGRTCLIFNSKQTIQVELLPEMAIQSEFLSEMAIQVG
jgi:hypothetical protein